MPRVMMCYLKEADVLGAESASEQILKHFVSSLNCATAFEEYLQLTKNAEVGQGAQSFDQTS